MLATTTSLIVENKGLQDYATCYAAMRDFTEARTPQTPDALWLVRHAPVYTLGQAGKPEHLLVENTGIPLVQIDRGGQITYHGPGQVVIYLLIDLRRRNLYVSELVRRMEQAIIDTLTALGIASERHAGAPGIYLVDGAHRGAKIAQLGLKIRKGCSYHGLSLNVDMDLQPFQWINPCGYAGLETIDLRRLGVAESPDDVAQRLAQALQQQLNLPTGKTHSTTVQEPL